MPFLSLQEIGADAKDEWIILQYQLASRDQLRLRYVDPDAFEDVIDDSAAVSERLASRLEDPDVITELLSCNRSEPGP